MDNEQIKNICLSLMKADTEEEVVLILKKADYWDNPIMWRYYGDNENNYSTIGNQQSRPDAALVEKIINSVDACLMNECLVRGINPEGKTAPQNIQQAVADFFDEDSNQNSMFASRIRAWPDAKRTEIAKKITFVATGVTARDGNPCFTISDCGEGQTPEKMPDTFLSLNKSNKLRIPFVQGKFNMGGTGVLRFGGHHRLQLILSRRNQAILNNKYSHPTDNQWGFTIVRREDPKGGLRSTVYTYLAPVNVDANHSKGGILRFTSKSMPIFPKGRDAYIRESEWGTLIKLYEYSALGYKTHILRKDGLLSRIDLLLPDVALPVRLHECRLGYKGHEGSFDTTVTGIGVRLDDDRAENLEEGFPTSCPMNVMGQQMTVTIYAFKSGKAETYRKDEGIIFTINGQTHGHFTTDFFRREKKVGLSYLRDSILVIVDCTKFNEWGRADLFMNSRDRLCAGELRNEIENALEEMLKNHEGLRALKERRKREEIETKLEDNKPLEDILASILKQSETLSSLFSIGKRLSTPFKTITVQQQEKQYKGNRHPTYFKFKEKKYGEILNRECHINFRCRVAFETDAENDYFSRTSDQGAFSLFMIQGNARLPVDDYVGPNLNNGIATLNVKLPSGCKIGDKLSFVSTVTDPSRLEPFENHFVITVKEEAKTTGGKGTRVKPPSEETGEDREIPSGISLPEVIPVYEADWGKHNFTKYTALTIKSDIDSESKNEQVNYYFYVNMDNVFLKSELKTTNLEIEIIKSRFQSALVLLGLGLIQEDKRLKKPKEDSDTENNEQNGKVNIEDKIEEFTRAVAPVLLPMIEYLGGLGIESSPTEKYSGEAT